MSKSIYDERLYLNSNSLIEYFIDEGYERKEKLIEEQALHKNIINEYDQLINELASFIKSLGYDKSLDISFLISYLINKGYLSDDMNFKKEEKEDLLLSRLGLTIIEGYGVCRNYASIHKDIFDELSIYDKKLYCKEKSLINRNQYANHVINLIQLDNNYYGIDIYNGNRLYQFINELDLKEISLNSNNKLKYKPYYELTTGESTEEDIYNYLLLFQNASQNKYINAFDYDDRKCEIRNRIKNDEKAYIEFHDKHKKLIKSINHNIK